MHFASYRFCLSLSLFVALLLHVVNYRLKGVGIVMFPWEGSVCLSIENFGSLLTVRGKLRVKTEILTTEKLRFIRSLLLFIQLDDESLQFVYIDQLIPVLIY